VTTFDRGGQAVQVDKYNSRKQAERSARYDAKLTAANETAQARANVKDPAAFASKGEGAHRIKSEGLDDPTNKDWTTTYRVIVIKPKKDSE
jgi:hypothetical protein